MQSENTTLINTAVSFPLNISTSLTSFPGYATAMRYATVLFAQWNTTPGTMLPVRIYSHPISHPIRKACGACAGLACTRANNADEIAIAPHLLLIDESSFLSIAPLNTASSTIGASSAITKYPPGVDMIFANMSPAVSGSSGNCSCNHTEGITTPKAAKVLHVNIAHGLDLMNSLPTGVHFLQRNNARVNMLDVADTTTNANGLSTAIPNINPPAFDTIICMAAKTTRYKITS